MQRPFLVCLASMSAIVGAWAAPNDSAFVDEHGVSHIPHAEIPYSDLASIPQRERFLLNARPSVIQPKDSQHALTKENAQSFNDSANSEAREKIADINRKFDVTTVESVIGGVPVFESTPNAGIPSANKEVVLINLHGGSFILNSGADSQVGAIPVAGIGKFKVISIDYRQAPKFQYPAATEDVASVYKTLLRRYKPRNIGIFGCSTGSLLTAEATAWFQNHQLPAPGAIGLFGEGALVRAGDSFFTKPILTGKMPPASQGTVPLESDWYFPDKAVMDAQAFPAEDQSVISHFPPTLLISGTRDIGLSQVVVTHARLVSAGVDADLHVWEGATHCVYATLSGSTNVPEDRETWRVIVRFFQKHLQTRH